MKHDLVHIQGKPYVVVPLHEYRQLAGSGADAADLPEELQDRLVAGVTHPVKTVRKFRGLTQESLAGLAGLSRPYLAEIETGKKEGSLAALKALAGALGVPVGILLGDQTA